MPIADYNQNPALRPTVLARDVPEKVYRPSRELLAARPDASENQVVRDEPRAA
jgi:hypothetical protein